MCGILGAVPIIEQNLFRLMLNKIAHRGPDAQNIWSDNKYIILGHRRLSIIDTTELGAQPMHYGGRYCVVFNGEIYNFLEIKKELEALGFRFKTDSDTEVLLVAFMLWGEKCVEKFNGMWAFALWDNEEHKLFLSRDRLGEKPLYYIYNNSSLIFASEQKALLPFLNNVEPSDNFRSLCKNSYDYESTSESLFKGIKRFPAAHNGWFNNGKLNFKRYWNVYNQNLTIPKDYQEQVVVLRDLLFDSCKIRMRSDVAIGTGLSGGIDSSAIVASIATVGKTNILERTPANWQNAFTISFDDSIMDETKYARKVAHCLGIKLNEISIDQEHAIDNIEKNVFMLEDIHEVNPIPHFELYKNIRKSGIYVCLDGHGGDELFCGYESSILHAIGDAIPSIEKIEKILCTYRNVHPEDGSFHCLSNSEIVCYLLKQKIRNSIKSIRSDIKKKKNIGYLNQHLFELSFQSVLPTLLRNYDRYSMASGVEIRIPLLDHRIVEFAFAIPWSSKIRNGFSKAILRDAVAPYLPQDIVKRKSKIGFAPPIGKWIRGSMRNYILDEINSKSFRESYLIDSARVKSAFNNLFASDSPGNLYLEEKIWREFSIYLWEKVFIKTKHL